MNVNTKGKTESFTKNTYKELSQLKYLIKLGKYLSEILARIQIND